MQNSSTCTREARKETGCTGRDEFNLCNEERESPLSHERTDD